MIRRYASRLPRIAGLMQLAATVGTPFPKGLTSQFGIKFKKARKNSGISNKKVGHFGWSLSWNHKDSPNRGL
jgi:hypothetical protein